MRFEHAIDALNKEREQLRRVWQKIVNDNFVFAAPTLDELEAQIADIEDAINNLETIRETTGG